MKPGAALTPMPKTLAQAAYAVEIAERAAQAAEDGEPGQARRGVGLVRAHLAPDLAERTGERTVGVQRAVAGDERSAAAPTRTNAKGSRPAGGFIAAGRTNPKALRRSSMRGISTPPWSSWSLGPG